MSEPLMIAGGGLAGLSLGLALARAGANVTLAEAGHYPRHRVCGEFMAGIRPETLDTLSLTDLVSDGLWHHETAWFEKDRERYRGRLPRPALGLSRFALDQRMAAAFTAAGGILKTGYRLPAADQSQTPIIWANGKKSHAQSRWIGLKGHFRDLDLRSDLEIHFLPGGYVGLSPVEEGWVNVCGLFPRSGFTPDPSDPWSALRQALRQGSLSSLEKRLDQATFRKGSFCATAAFLPGHPRWSPDRLQLGDRLGMMPPFTGNGMTFALESAALALPQALAYTQGKVSATNFIQETNHILSRKLLPRLRWARRLHPFIWNPKPRQLLLHLGQNGLLPWKTLFNLTH
jgi:flavin-dependent dehydrogenase